MVLVNGFGKTEDKVDSTVVYADGAAWDGAVEEDENGSDRVGVTIDLSCNTLPVELVLLKTASVDQARGVENGSLEKRLRVFHVRKHQHLLLYCYCSWVRKGEQSWSDSGCFARWYG